MQGNPLKDECRSTVEQVIRKFTQDISPDTWWSLDEITKADDGTHAHIKLVIRGIVGTHSHRGELSNIIVYVNISAKAVDYEP